MAKYGLLIDYNYCTGCHSCEVAIDYLPYPTDLCDLCINRHQAGEEPSCVKHCQSRCMQFGYLHELVTEMEERPKMVLFAPR